MDEVIVTRRIDGAQFKILSQARSPEGPVTLERVARPCDRLEVSGSVFVRDFYDPRKGLDVSGIPAADDYERRSAEAVRAKARSDAERILAAVKLHLDGGRKLPFDPVMRGGPLSDGGVAMANEALAPLRWRVECREMGWTLEPAAPPSTPPG